MAEGSKTYVVWMGRAAMAAIALGVGWVIFASPDGRKNRMCEDQTSAYYNPDHPDCRDG